MKFDRGLGTRGRVMYGNTDVSSSKSDSNGGKDLNEPAVRSHAPIDKVYWWEQALICPVWR